MPRDPRFSILLPPGWARILVDDETDNTFRVIVQSVVAKAPAERRRDLRSMLEVSIRDMLAAARSGNTVDLIVSLEAVRNLPLPLSLTVAVVQPPDEGGLSPEEQLLRFASGSARAIELDGLIGVRRSTDSVGDDTTPQHRTVSYLVHLPWADEWLLFSSAIITTDESGYDVVLEALESLIDAMISTVRFTKTEVTT